MEFTSRTVRSRPGLDLNEALASLQEAPFYKPGSKIASITPRADRWIAELQIPKTAAPFPPSSDEESAEPAEPKPPKDEGGEDDGPPDLEGESEGDSGGESKPKADKPGSDAQVVQILTQILHALQGGPPMGGMGGPDDLGPGAGGPPAPPPHGGPAGGPGAAPPKGMGAGRPIKPGEVPNKPGVMPIGSPAFASTHTANPLPPNPMGGPTHPGPNPMNPAGAMGAPPTPGPTSQGGTGTCSHCGGPIGPDGSCPTCGGSYVAALRQSISKVAGRTATMTVIAPDRALSVSDTVRLVRAVTEPHGYRVKQATRTQDGRAAVLVSTR